MGFGRYAEQFELGRSPLDTRGLRLGRWKLTRYSTGEAELYDLKTDPLELRNLARVTAYAGTLRQLGRSTSATTTAAGESAASRCRPQWRLSLAESRELTQHQVQATNSYYGNEDGPDRANDRSTTGPLSEG